MGGGMIGNWLISLHCILQMEVLFLFDTERVGEGDIQGVYFPTSVASTEPPTSRDLKGKSPFSNLNAKFCVYPWLLKIVEEQ